MKVEEVLKDWKSLSKIASLLMIEEHEVWTKVFKGRKIVQYKLTGAGSTHNYIMMYKEEV